MVLSTTYVYFGFIIVEVEIMYQPIIIIIIRNMKRKETKKLTISN